VDEEGGAGDQNAEQEISPAAGEFLNLINLSAIAEKAREEK
jgi:hypothetical protein